MGVDRIGNGRERECNLKMNEGKARERKRSREADKGKWEDRRE